MSGNSETVLISKETLQVLDREACAEVLRGLFDQWGILNATITQSGKFVLISEDESGIHKTILG